MNEESEWLPFKGVAEDDNDNYILKAPKGFGSFQISRQDAQINGEDIQVRKGAQVTIIEKPDDTLQPVEFRSADGCRPCSVRLPATGSPFKVPHQGCESVCYGLVLVCQYCNYDANGINTGESSEVCGACIGFPF